jgi:hypothetical protein
MKKNILILLIALFVNCRAEREIPDKLSGFITTQLAQKDSTIRFSEFSDVIWNKLYVLTPYTNESQFNEDLNDYKGEILRTGIKASDSENVLLLYNGKILVSISEISRGQIDFAKAGKLISNKVSFYTKPACIFKFRTEDKNRLVVDKP